MEEGERGEFGSGYISPWSLCRQNYKDGAKNVGKLEPRPTTWCENVSHALGTLCLCGARAAASTRRTLRRSMCSAVRARRGGSQIFQDFSPAGRPTETVSGTVPRLSTSCLHTQKKNSKRKKMTTLCAAKWVAYKHKT
ncbi:hypothetical protein E2C01_023384 [Portunus trituberculatus]|uniref:Uncharacterized protein n=1 Tax=Portunus trituberculatus TaxID=210409 RepID=A0A5B7E9V9_PORTR|nr:hypothetical protein [Portunus trituberculatus]